MANETDKEKILRICIHDYLVQKNFHTTANAFLREANLSQQDLHLHSGPEFFDDWWKIVANTYFPGKSYTPPRIENSVTWFLHQRALKRPRSMYLSNPASRFPLHGALNMPNTDMLPPSVPVPSSTPTNMPNTDMLPPSTPVPSSTPMNKSASSSMNPFMSSKQQLVEAAIAKNLDYVERLSPEPSGANDAIKNSADDDFVKMCLTSSGPSLVEVKTINSNSGQLICCDFTSEGDMLACITQDKKMVLWNTHSNTYISTSKSQNQSPITDLRFVPGLSNIAASYLNRTVVLWETYNTSRSLDKLWPYEPVISMDFNPNNVDQLCCGDKNEIKLWSVSNCTYQLLFSAGTRQVRYQRGHGKVLAALLMVNKISIFDVETKSVIFSFKGHEKDIHTICWDATGKYLASVSEDQARVWSFESGGKLIHEIRSNGKKFESCTFHPQYAQAFVIGSYQSLEVWNPCESNITESVSAHSGIVSALCTCSSTGLIASTSNDNCIKLWRPRDEIIT